MNASRPWRSRTRPSCAYVSSPKEWAKPPAGKSPSANCSSVSSAGSGIMAVSRSERHEHGVQPLEGDAQPCEKVVHGRVVRDEHAVAVDREGEVAVPHLEGDAQRRVARYPRDRQDRFRRALHDEVPVRADMEDLSGSERAAGRERQDERPPPGRPGAPYRRSEEHTSELQSQSNLVCRLLLEKKK